MKTNQLFALAAIALCIAYDVFSQTWTQTNASNGALSSVASSADGSKLIVVGSSWNYFTSTNSGANWVSNGEPQSNSLIGPWYCIASSADGTKLLATTVSSAIFVSTNSGITWLSNNVPSVVYWGPVAMSADGSKLVAAAGGTGHPPGYIYISTNWGVSWNATSVPTNVWTGIASSADGTRLVAVAVGEQAFTGVIYISTNSGTSWTQTSAPSKNWSFVASSADGTKMVAVYQLETNSVPGHIYTTVDSGATWVSNGLATCVWQSVSVSADGNTIVAGGDGYYTHSDVYVSLDFGATWTSNLLSNDYFAGYVISVASSADGSKLFAISLGGQIYTAQSTPSPQLNLTPSPTNLALSWIIPSTNFVLQQSSVLTDWADLTNTPVLNLTNLQNQVTLPQSASNGFFRLKTP